MTWDPELVQSVCMLIVAVSFFFTTILIWRSIGSLERRMRRAEMRLVAGGSHRKTGSP